MPSAASPGIPNCHSESIADEWVRMTFNNDPAFVAPVVPMMMASREAVVDYMTPLGLHHLLATGHHYGPGPWVNDLDAPTGIRSITTARMRRA